MGFINRGARCAFRIPSSSLASSSTYSSHMNRTCISFTRPRYIYKREMHSPLLHALSIYTTNSPSSTKSSTLKHECVFDFSRIAKTHLSTSKLPTSSITATPEENAKKGDGENASQLQAQRERLAREAKLSEDLWDRLVPERKMGLTSPGFYVLLAAVLILHFYNNYRAKRMENEESESAKQERVELEKVRERREKRRKVIEGIEEESGLEKVREGDDEGQERNYVKPELDQQ